MVKHVENIKLHDTNEIMANRLVLDLKDLLKNTLAKQMTSDTAGNFNMQIPPFWNVVTSPVLESLMWR